MVDVSTHNFEKERADDTNMHMLICCTICFRSVFIHLSGDMFLFDGENIVSTDRICIFPLLLHVLLKEEELEYTYSSK